MKISKKNKFSVWWVIICVVVFLILVSIGLFLLTHYDIDSGCSKLFPYLLTTCKTTDGGATFCCCNKKSIVGQVSGVCIPWSE